MPDSPRPGFRLVRLEVLNWGTFHKRIWGLDLGGSNTLLTGDIGSGKSTLVDAVTALMVPRVNFNKAAGAAAGERSTETYFFGRYKSERGEPGLTAKPVSLRGADSYSVILGRFVNEALGQHVTLAQVFWAKGPQGAPARLFAIADAPLSIKEHFSAFGPDVNALKKRLRKNAAVTVYESFPPYMSAYRHRFGIENEQAMDLFHQTISMKSVGNLTDFVREHMLQAWNADERIEALIHHYQDLERAHEMVVQAGLQIGFLTPVIADCDAHDALVGKVETLRACREALRPWFAARKAALLETRLTSLDADLKKLGYRIAALDEDRQKQIAKRDAIRQSIAEQGGDRMERIKTEIAARQEEKTERFRRAKGYEDRARVLGLPPAADAESFLANQHAIRQSQLEAEAAFADAQNNLTEKMVGLRQLQSQYDEIEAELDSLQRRRSNLPRRNLEIRAELCHHTGLREDDLPYAGELLQIRPNQLEWEGAVERLLNSFALSLLVRDENYQRVAAWVDRTNLGGKLVYLRVLPARPVNTADIHRDAASQKIAIKPDSPFYAWLDSRIAARFNHACCSTLDQFRREPLAITRTGQIKGGDHHEKDDRRPIDDRSRYVLGWSNQPKIDALRREQQRLQQLRAPLMTRIDALDKDMKEAGKRKTALSQLDVFDSFRELDWRPLVSEIDRLERERKELEEGSDVLRTLESQLLDLEGSMKAAEEKLQADRTEEAKLAERQARALESLDACEVLLAGTNQEVKVKTFPLIEPIAAEVLAGHTVTVESCDNRAQDVRESLQARIDAEDKRIRGLEEKIVKAMQSYRTRFKLDEADVSVAAAAEYRAILQRLTTDDLPRFQGEFKRLLNENTIREVANFQSQLNRERETIRERIDIINRSLRGIDYERGRYIELEAAPNPDPEVKDFQSDLRACIEGSLTMSEAENYSEEKFLQVKSIIARLRGREGTGEIDKRWRAKVTDVRHWFVFSASERWREDNSEYQHHTDSGGRSGGQKEKLAYTVLAASLAYQFGLEMDAPRARSFRFVVIDEAFGRGSDESARFGLRLFSTLQLQLLVVTPLQKINVIEPFVSAVGFVHCEDGKISMLRNLTIEEYRAERMARGT